MPTIFRPDIRSVSVGKGQFRFGDVLELRLPTSSFRGVVLDVDEDEGGAWVGVCPLDSGLLLGHCIPDRTRPNGYIDLLKIYYIHVDLLSNARLLDHLFLDVELVGVGQQYPISQLDDLERDHRWRLTMPRNGSAPCDEMIIGDDQTGHYRAYPASIFTKR